MASEDDGNDYDDGYDYDDGDASGNDDGDAYDYDDDDMNEGDGDMYEANDDGDYGLDFAGNDEDISEDIACNQGDHGDCSDPNHDYLEEEHGVDDDVLDSDSDHSGDGDYRDPNHAYDEEDDDDRDHDNMVDSDSDDSEEGDYNVPNRDYDEEEDDDDDPDDLVGNDSYDSGDISQQSEKVYLEFDGASKGNPGRAGAGAVLKSEDGTVITRVREGLGEGTNNDAEYRSLIQGLKTALDMGYDRIHAKGDSRLVVEQVKGEWQTRNDKMAKYRDEARKLSDQCKEFEISHVPRGLNTDADAEANKAVNLPAGRLERVHFCCYAPMLSLLLSQLEAAMWHPWCDMALKKNFHSKTQGRDG